jgi:uncharacterized protein YqhQ
MSKRTYYGGQAVIEGVMMRGRKNMVTAVKRPGGGTALDIRPLSGLYTSRLRRLPLVRGIIVLIEALLLGIKVLLYSANVALEEEKTQLSGGSMWLVLGGALIFAVAVFFLAPLFLTRLINPYISSSIVFHLVEGVIRLAIFIAYLKVVSMMPDIRRVYAYHGAEHKTVNAYEAGVPLEVESIKKYSTAHVRCGTSFLFAVLVIAIVVFALIGRHELWLMVLARVLLVPVIAALGYEVTYFAGRHTGNLLVRTILTPGLWLQALTTREPDDSMLEVAIAALTKVIELDNVAEAAETAS